MRILIIEDEHKIATALKKALQTDNYAVDVSYDGDDGYAMATTEPYDLAIIDWMIPGEYNGVDIVKAMRKEKIHTPVLLLSAKGTIKDRTTGLDSGADDYLVKPFNTEELIARMNVALRHQRPDLKETTFKTGDLTIDFENRTVSVKKREINITPTEYSILSFLARNPGRIVTQDRLLKEIWGPISDAESGSLRVHISSLRKKIESDPARPELLITEPSIGYRLVIKNKGW